MKKVKKILVLSLVIAILSSFAVSAENGSYKITWKDFEDNPYTQATLNGVYQIEENGGNNAYMIEVGTSVTIELPTKDLFISDDEKDAWNEDARIYNLYGVEKPEVCTVSNLVKTSENRDGGIYEYYKPGIKVVFNKPGKYSIETFGADFPEDRHSNNLYCSFTVVDKGGIDKLQEEQRKANTAKYTNSKVLVNGVLTTFEAYNLGGNNYFKLRDLAMAVNGTEKQFAIMWNEDTKQITIYPGEAYTPVGGELAAGDGQDKIGTPYDTPLSYKHLYGVGAKAYNIKGNNYFKLRDICRILDIGVTWDGATSTIGIDTSVPYTE